MPAVVPSPGTWGKRMSTTLMTSRAVVMFAKRR